MMRFAILIFLFSFASAQEEIKVSEVKVAIDSNSIIPLLKSLKLNSKISERLNIYFLDTPKLQLYQKGIVLRFREFNKTTDFTIKSRPGNVDIFSDNWWKEKNFKCEADTLLKKSVTSCSLNTELDNNKYLDVKLGLTLVESLLDLQQEHFLSLIESHRLPFSRLKFIGPITAYRWTVENVQPNLPKVNFELWILSNGTRFLEVSSKTKISETATIQKLLLNFVRSHGARVNIDADNKTKTAIESYLIKN
jgi:uncharacterized protein YjbK